MAYIKIFPIKVTDKKALDYITNPDKTDEKLLVSSFGCSPETADLEFAMTRESAKKNGMDKGNNLAFHLIQSFKPGEVDAETAHRLGQQFADEVLKGKYEYVISTHVDKNHIHNHIIFNAASFVDHHKYVSNKRSYHKLCRISNRICQENGLATSMPTGEKGKSYKENLEYHRGTSWKAKLRVNVDKAIWSSVNYDEFLQKMQLTGYEVRQGKHLSFRAPEQKNFHITLCSQFVNNTFHTFICEQWLTSMKFDIHSFVFQFFCTRHQKFNSFIYCFLIHIHFFLFVSFVTINTFHIAICCKPKYT